MKTFSLAISLLFKVLHVVSGQYSSAKALDCREGFKAYGTQLIEQEFKCPSIINCNLRCLASQNCVATNFQMLIESGRGHCELLRPHEFNDGSGKVVLSKQINSIYTRIKPGVKAKVIFAFNALKLA